MITKVAVNWMKGLRAAGSYLKGVGKAYGNTASVLEGGSAGGALFKGVNAGHYAGAAGIAGGAAALGGYKAFDAVTSPTAKFQPKITMPGQPNRLRTAISQQMYPQGLGKTAASQIKSITELAKDATNPIKANNKMRVQVAVPPLQNPGSPAQRAKNRIAGRGIQPVGGNAYSGGRPTSVYV